MGVGNDGRRQWTAQVARVLANLAPEHERSPYDVSGSGATAMAWLGLDLTVTAPPLAAPKGLVPKIGAADYHPAWRIGHGRGLEVLAQYDAMTPTVANLSLGWLWLTGTITVDGSPQRIIRPLASTRAEVLVGKHDSTIVAAPAWDLWPLARDPQIAGQLEQTIEFGGGGLSPAASYAYLRRFPRLLAWANSVLEASELPRVSALTPPADPRHTDPTRLQLMVGYGCFTEGANDLLRPREALRAWSTDAAIDTTAFASMYLGAPAAPAPRAPGGRPPAPEPLRCSLPLTAAQELAVRRARTDPITVVSGPPGTGKSQTAVAIASDAVARGERVLVATQSPMAADVLAHLLDRVPGPTPVLFGGSRRSGELAAKLADGLDAQLDEGADDIWSQRKRRHEELLAAVEADLADARALEEWPTVLLTLGLHRQRAPGLFDTTSPGRVAHARVLLAESEPEADDGWWDERRRRRAESDLRELVDAPDEVTLAELGAAIDAAEVRERVERASDRDLKTADARWIALAEAEEDLRYAEGRRAAAEVAERANGPSRRAVAALATALRAGRAQRRAHLSRVDVGSLTTALPLWIGTLGDIESLLPAVANAFDLVILDEASMIDQSSASSALLRAGRAVIIGDPRQLRFVSFLSDAQVEAAVVAEGCLPLADRLDVRRISAFDLAAGNAPVTFLDEHFRSVPHLIGFSAQRFYDGRLQVVTRHPRNDGVPAIEVVRLDGERVDGVNRREVEEATSLVARFITETDATIGVVSPHRAQVDALRASVANAVDLEHWQSGRVRVATVHGFQGSECDIVIASFGLSEDGGRSRRFLEDPNLFNVMVTRARERMIVLASLGDLPAGLLADYLRWAEHVPAPLPDDGPADDWTAKLADLIRDQEVPVHAGYRVGAWSIDLVVGDGPDALAVSTRVHPDGAHAHLRRYLTLHQVGWRQTEAFPVTEEGGAARLAMALAARLRRR